LVHDGQAVDVRARNAYTQSHEKYLQLAREAQSAGDRVAAEGFHQHAEHYFRMLALVTAVENERRAAESVEAAVQTEAEDDVDPLVDLSTDAGSPTELPTDHTLAPSEGEAPEVTA
jgi:hypothetical protein